MGGQSQEKTTTQSSQTAPWAPSQGLLTGILGQLGGYLGNSGLSGAETGALDRLSANAGGGNPWAEQIGSLANSLFSGGPDRTGLINDAYRQYQERLNPIARGDYLNPDANPVLQRYLGKAGDDAASRVAQSYAAAGRDPTGAGSYGMNVGRGVSEAQTPILYDAYNRALADQRSAIDALYGAGGQTAGLLSSLDQTALGNRQAGVGAAGAALDARNWGAKEQLAIEAQRRGIPLDYLSRIAGMGTGIARLGSQSTGTSTETTETPFNPWSLAPLALAPFTGGTSLAGMGAGMFGRGIYDMYGGFNRGSGPRVGPFSY